MYETAVTALNENTLLTNTTKSSFYRKCIHGPSDRSLGISFDNCVKKGGGHRLFIQDSGEHQMTRVVDVLTDLLQIIDRRDLRRHASNTCDFRPITQKLSFILFIVTSCTDITQKLQKYSEYYKQHAINIKQCIRKNLSNREEGCI